MGDGVVLLDLDEVEHFEFWGLVDVEGVREVVTERLLVMEGEKVTEFVADGLLEALPHLEGEDERLMDWVKLLMKRETV